MLVCKYFQYNLELVGLIRGDDILSFICKMQNWIVIAKNLCVKIKSESIIMLIINTRFIVEKIYLSFRISSTLFMLTDLIYLDFGYNGFQKFFGSIRKYKLVN